MYLHLLIAICDLFYLESKVCPTSLLPIQCLFYLLLFLYLLRVYCMFEFCFTYNLKFYLQSRLCFCIFYGLIAIRSLFYLESRLQVIAYSKFVLLCYCFCFYLFIACFNFVLLTIQSFTYNLDFFLYLHLLIAIRDLLFLESTLCPTSLLLIQCIFYLLLFLYLLLVYCGVLLTIQTFSVSSTACLLFKICFIQNLTFVLRGYCLFKVLFACYCFCIFYGFIACSNFVLLTI